MESVVGGMLVKERQILMTPENAQKCHDGRKTQTRRIIKSQPPEDVGKILGPEMYAPGKVDKFGEEYPGEDVFGVYSVAGEWGAVFPYGQVGERIWVRENGWERPARTSKMLRDGADTWKRFYFDALLDSGEAEELKGYGFKRRPSIHMPRWACRTVLEITEVRVERVQDISEEDAKAEGVTRIDHGREYYFSAMRDEPDHRNWGDPTDAYKELWESIHGKGSWELNPWVWVIEFRKVEEDVND